MSKKLLVCLVTISLILLLIPVAFAQKWGKVSKEILEMTSVAEDAEADAVVLFDIGEIRITSNFDMKFRRHRRIKILTERGKKYADISIGYWHEDQVDRIKAHTILPDGKKVKVKKQNIFEEKSDIFKKKVFTFPAVEIGSVIEYQYEKFSEYLTFLEPWYFQDEEFTKMSRLSVYLTSEFSYNVFFTNLSGLSPKPIKEKLLDPNRQGRHIYKYTWERENVPPVKFEPYMTTLKDYLSAIYFQLSVYRDRYTFHQYMKSWDDMAKRMQENYNDFFDDNKRVKEFLATILPDSVGGLIKAELIYDYLIKYIETTEYKGFLGSRLKKPRQVLEDRTGSAVAKNLLLINLLRCAGFEAHPVLISTRDHGKIQDGWIQLQQFNHTIACLQVGYTSYFLDTKNRYCPFGTLPPDDIVAKGLLIKEKQGKIIKFPTPTATNMSYSSIKAALNENGDLNCEAIFRYDGYRGISEREKLSDKPIEDYLEEKLTDRFGGVTIDSFEINDIEKIETPLSVRVNYQIPNYAQIVGDMIYTCPVLMHRREINPFKREKRNFPVEYDYPFTSSEDVEMIIPDGCKTLEIPNTVNYGLPGGRFISTCEENNNTIKYQRHFSINKVFFHPREYAELRSFYERIVSADQCQIVLSQAK